MQETFLEELIFSGIHVAQVVALAQIQDNIFEELFLKYVFDFARSLCMDKVAVFTHPWCQYIGGNQFRCKHRKIFLANIGFVPGGTLLIVSK